MTPIQQQRLLGLGLLLLLVSVVAFFLISSANEYHQVELDQVTKQQDNFASLIEPIDDEAEIIVDDRQEALVNPHDLDTLKPVETPVEKETVAVKPAPSPQRKAVETVQSKIETSLTPMWTAQLASFSIKANADALAEKVKKQGYDVELLTNKTVNKTIYRVRLQAETNKSSVEKKAAALKKTMQLSPQVLKVTN